MKMQYKLFVLIFLGMFTLKANHPLVLETKVIEKTFNVNENAELRIDNRYGNITMTTWDKNVVQIHVEIKVDGKNAETVKKRINAINVEFTADSGLVTATTKIDNVKKGNNTNIEIHYTVKLPKSNNIEIANRYGNIYLDELKGKSKIDLQYGSMSLGKLYNSLNSWDLDYISNSTVELVKSAIIQAGYSHIDIRKAEVLNLNADYTDIKIGEVEDLINLMSYGNLVVSKVNRVSNTADYTNVKIGTLVHSFVSTGDYGGISIESVTRDFEKIDVSADYSSLNIGINPKASYKLQASFKYAKLNYPDNVNMKKLVEKSTSSIYEGIAGNGSGSIQIQMEFGGAKIKLNN